MLSVGLGTKAADGNPRKYDHGIVTTLDKKKGMKTTAAVITKGGKPVVKPVPADKDADEICGFLAGEGAVKGDVASPATSRGEWGDLK